jgi:LacI family transcriptional regulator
VVTSWDIARKAGVSQATVSRVINGSDRVAPETRLRVMEVVEQLGYAPNAIARGLVTSRTQLVGVIGSDVTNPFYPELLEAMSARLSDHGLKMLFYNTGRNTADGDYVRFLQEHRVDGFIFASATLDSEVVRELAEQSFPLVLTNRYVDDLDCDVVVADNVGGAAAAARHLLELGHQEIAIIEGSPNTSTSRDRVSSFRMELERAGVGVPDEFIARGEFLHDLAYRATAELLTLRRRPSAIFCANDLMALGAINAAIASGVRVPEEVSIVGFDAIAMSRWDAFRLTTVRQPISEMARACVDRLEKRIGAPELRTERLVFASELVVGSSTGPPPRTRRDSRAVSTRGGRKRG